MNTKRLVYFPVPRIPIVKVGAAETVESHVRCRSETVESPAFSEIVPVSVVLYETKAVCGRQPRHKNTHRQENHATYLGRTQYHPHPPYKKPTLLKCMSVNLTKEKSLVLFK